MKWMAAIAALGLLAACGADGPPERPEGGIRIETKGTIGISGTL